MDTGTGIAVGALALGALLGGAYYLNQRSQQSDALAAAEERAKAAEALAQRTQQPAQQQAAAPKGNKVVSGITTVWNALGGANGLQSLVNSLSSL